MSNTIQAHSFQDGLAAKNLVHRAPNLPWLIERLDVMNKLRGNVIPDWFIAQCRSDWMRKHNPELYI